MDDENRQPPNVSGQNQRQNAEGDLSLQGKIVISLPTQTTKNNRVSDQCAGGFAQWVSIVFSFCLLLVTVKQCNVSKTQADIMDTQNRLTESIQRASIAVSDLREEIINTPAEALIWRYTPAIKNTGSTPAKNISMVAIRPEDNKSVIDFLISKRLTNMAKGGPDNAEMVKSADEYKPYVDTIKKTFYTVGPPDPEEPLDFSRDDILWLSNNITRNITIGGGGTIYLSNGSEEFRTEDALAVQGVNTPNAKISSQSNIGWYFYGAIRYQDIFDPKKIHVSKYCFIIAGYSSSLSGPKIVPSYCKHWNCIDETCEADKRGYQEDIDALYRREAENAAKIQEFQKRRNEVLK